MSEPNFLADLGADFCDRHETPFKFGDRCPVCVKTLPDDGGDPSRCCPDCGALYCVCSTNDAAVKP